MLIWMLLDVVDVFGIFESIDICWIGCCIACCYIIRFLGVCIFCSRRFWIVRGRDRGRINDFKGLLIKAK